jgi:AcrR family transcriptional regulator
MTKTLKGARMNPLARKQKILEAAISLAIVSGYRNITRKDVAIASDSAQGLVSRYFKTVANLKKEVVREALEREIMPILVENLLDRPIARINLPLELKDKVIHYLLN